MSACQGAKNYQVRCRGAVQGRGIRPMIAVLATKLGIHGCVYNDLGGVRVLLSTTGSELNEFLSSLAEMVGEDVLIEAALADSSEHSEDFEQALAAEQMVIVASQPVASSFHLPKDIGICGQCASELKDINAWRKNYLLNACAQCGPRYSVLNRMPYDRKNTSLNDFELCAVCTDEYADRNNRRYHSQLINCHQCGPQYWLEDTNGKTVSEASEEVVSQLMSVILVGGIVAIKNIGGFHLCCDATNQEAVARIREIKYRPHKPFAIMGDLPLLTQYCHISDGEADVLQSNARPIVLLESKDREALAGVAPESNKLGAMLPSTALQILLIEKLSTPLVMTSANVSGQAMIYENEKIKSLQSKLDLIAFNHRDIVNPIDDAVLAISNNRLATIRLAKGIAPYVSQMVDEKNASEHVIAMGAELKNSYGFLRGGEIFLSPYQGDLHNADIYERYKQLIQRDIELFQLQPTVIAIDSHPDYHSTQLGRYLAQTFDASVEMIQHHHAHAVACMVEHRLPLDEPTLAIVMDGYGWGEDNTLWGGELLAVTSDVCDRLACIKPFPVIGGYLTAKQPWRNSLSLLHELPDKAQKSAASRMVLSEDNQPLTEGVKHLLAKTEQPLLTSSVGRLFDGVAALLGFPESEISFDGQAAIWLQQKAEAYLSEMGREESASVLMPNRVLLEGSDNCLWIDSGDYIERLNSRDSTEFAAYEFHSWLANSFVASVKQSIENRTELTVSKKIVLSGGVMQNQLLLGLLNERLSQLGYNVYWPQQVPCNDGGIALGQLAIAAARRGEMNQK